MEGLETDYFPYQRNLLYVTNNYELLSDENLLAY